MILIKQIPVKNDYQNYMYLVACSDTREAVAIDPLDDILCLETARTLDWQICGVINTHEHLDHTGGNEEVLAATGATLYAHHHAMDKIANVDVGLKAGDAVQVGTSVQLIALDTPGHTFCHTCLYYKGDEDNPPSLFSGDTLFNAGVGNCFNGGNAQTMYQTFAEQIFTLPDETQVYPGHDYIINNLKFTLDREPNNFVVKSLLYVLEQWNGENHYISNLAMEKEVNAFFRLQSITVIAMLRVKFPELGKTPDAETVFLKLRELRDKW